MEEIEIIKPDDWHVHFRDGKILEAVIPETTRHFARAIIMPNLVPPILKGIDAVKYKERIQNAIPKKDSFLPFMTIYLTENTSKHELRESYQRGQVFAAKLYPAGATTNSDSGVKDIKKIMPVLKTMSEIGMPLLIHGEVTDKEIDIFDREKVFIDQKLDFICKKLPKLKITLEHITTKEATEYVYESNENLGASITPHHLALNRNAMFFGGIRPHNYCLPILKREIHRKYLVKAAISGNYKFFLGTDSAPHHTNDKIQNESLKAGIFSSPCSLELYVNIFEEENALEHFEKFSSINGPEFYGLAVNKEFLTLNKKEMNVPQYTEEGNIRIKNFFAGKKINWKVS